MRMKPLGSSVSNAESSSPGSLGSKSGLGTDLSRSNRMASVSPSTSMAVLSAAAPLTSESPFTAPAVPISPAAPLLFPVESAASTYTAYRPSSAGASLAEYSRAVTNWALAFRSAPRVWTPPPFSREYDSIL